MWNTSQGILPPQVNLISLGGDVVNNGDFISYPSAAGTVNMLAQGSVVLNQGFVLSDAELSVMPTLANIAALLAPYDQTVSAATEVTATLLPDYPQIGQVSDTQNSFTSQNIFYGGVNYLAGQNPIYFGPDSVIGGDQLAQLICDPTAATEANIGGAYGVAYVYVSPQIELERHAGLHVGDSNPTRIVALTGDVSLGRRDRGQCEPAARAHLRWFLLRGP